MMMENNRDHSEGTLRVKSTVQIAGAFIIRYGLVIILLWIGLLKFTAYEAKGIQGLVANSPLMGWGYAIFSVQGMAIVVGVIEIILAILIAIYRMAPSLSAAGSWGAVIMGLITLSFMFSTPGVIQMGHSFPLLSPMPGQFLLKDLLLLGAAVWTAGESQRLAGQVEVEKRQT